MKLRFFDFEVFPHWWCCVFGDMPEDEKTYEGIKHTFTVVQSTDWNARQKLLDMFREPNICMLGYNIKGYDLMIANAIYQGFTPEQVKIINDLIVSPNTCQWSTKEHIRLENFAKKRLPNVVYQDLMDDGNRTSLKERECSLGLNILESSVPFNKEILSNEDIDDILYYCKHDVYSSMVFYEKVCKGYTHTKNNLAKRFNISEDISRKCTNAKIVAKILDASPRTYDDELRTDMQIPTRVRQYVYDNLPTNIINHITTLSTSLNVKLYGNDVSFGDGGLHSVIHENVYAEQDNEYSLINVDVTSYYPSIMIVYDLLSRACNTTQIFKDIYNERVTIKHKADKTIEEEELLDGDKLVMNTTYGACGNKYIELYDPYRRSCVCKLGQLLLAAFANKCYNNVTNLSILQTNTDGVLMYLPRNQVDKLRSLKEEWMSITGLDFEEDIVDKIWQCNVNNYLMVMGNGKIKSKGGWLRTTQYMKGTPRMSPLTCFVASKAATDYLLYRKDIVKSIVDNKNIEDFAITCTKGSTFFKVVQKMNEGTLKEHEVDLYKSNRVIATKDESYGKLYKLKLYKGEVSYHQMPNIPEHSMVVNKDLSDYNFDELRKNIDYMYYVKRAADLLDIDWLRLVERELIPTHEFDIDC